MKYISFTVQENEHGNGYKIISETSKNDIGDVAAMLGVACHDIAFRSAKERNMPVEAVLALIKGAIDEIMYKQEIIREEIEEC